MQIPIVNKMCAPIQKYLDERRKALQPLTADVTFRTKYGFPATELLLQCTKRERKKERERETETERERERERGRDYLSIYLFVYLFVYFIC